MTVLSRTASRASTAAAAMASALAYPFLHQRVASHFDANGRFDRYSSRATVAITFPAMMTGLSIINDRLGAWPGGQDREDGASGVQAREEAIGLIELALLQAHLAVLARGVGLPIDMDRVNRGMFGALLIGLGNVLPKLPRNGLIGIRTPWTLADPTVWERTHRLGGYLLTAAGVMGVASMVTKSKRMAQFPLAATLGAVGLSAVYSFVVYTTRSRSKRR